MGDFTADIGMVGPDVLGQFRRWGGLNKPRSRAVNVIMETRLVTVERLELYLTLF